MFCKLYVSVVLIYNIMASNIHVKNLFISKSINLTTLIGETVEFNCTEYNIESQNSTTQLSWFKNEELLRNIIKKNPNRTFLDASSDTLTIRNVTNEDAGTYKCVTSNQSHSDISTYTLTVNDLPELKPYYVYTSYTTASKDHKAYIGCMGYMNHDAENYNNQTHLYFKDERPLFLNESNDRMKAYKNFDFMIYDIRYEDNGTYKCVTSNKFRIDYAVTYLKVVGNFHDDHHYFFSDEIVDQTKHLNESFFLPYQDGPWFKNDKPVIPSEENTHITFNFRTAKFEIKDLTFEDAGNYSCNGSYEQSETYNSHYSLNVIDQPEKLNFRLFNSNITLIIGKTFRLKCHIFQSTEKYTTWYSWKKNGEKLELNDNTEKMYFEKNQSILILSNLTSNESGIYECEAESYYHKVHSAYTLTLPDAKNSFISKSINLTTLIGKTVEFNCSENNIGSQKSTTQPTWFKNEKSLNEIIGNNSSKISLAGDGNVLRINNVTNEDAGTYKCINFNKSHSDCSIYTLTVYDIKKNIEQVNSNLSKSKFVEIFLLLGAVTILGCVLWLKRKQTTTADSDADKLQCLNTDREKWNADSDMEELI